MACRRSAVRSRLAPPFSPSPDHPFNRRPHRAKVVEPSGLALRRANQRASDSVVAAARREQGAKAPKNKVAQRQYQFWPIKYRVRRTHSVLWISGFNHPRDGADNLKRTGKSLASNCPVLSFWSIRTWFIWITPSMRIPACEQK
jgi:hypothetical protein